MKHPRGMSGAKSWVPGMKWDWTKNVTVWNHSNWSLSLLAEEGARQQLEHKKENKNPSFYQALTDVFLSFLCSCQMFGSAHSTDVTGPEWILAKCWVTIYCDTTHCVLSTRGYFKSGSVSKRVCSKWDDRLVCWCCASCTPSGVEEAWRGLGAIGLPTLSELSHCRSTASHISH